MFNRFFPAYAAAVFLAVAGLAMTVGCARWVEVNGVRYRALSESDTGDLIYRARLVLYRNTKIISRSDYRLATANPPRVEIDYTGDYRGKAQVAWVTPEREICVVYDGDLIADHPGLDGEGVNCLLKITDKSPELLDLSSRQKGGAAH